MPECEGPLGFQRQGFDILVLLDVGHPILDTSGCHAGARLRLLLQVNNSTTQEAVFAARNANPRWDPVAAANRLPEGWAEFLALFWACIVALQEGKRGEAYDKLVAALQPFIKARSVEGRDVFVRAHTA